MLTPPQTSPLSDRQTPPKVQAPFQDNLWDSMGADAMQFNSLPFLPDTNAGMDTFMMDNMLAAETFVTGDMADMWATAPQTFE